MTVVSGYDDVVQAVSDLGLSGNEALAVVGWIAAQRAGGAIRPASRTTEAKYRKLAREAGVCLAQGEIGSRRLDFDTGKEVMGGARVAPRRLPA